MESRVFHLRVHSPSESESKMDLNPKLDEKSLSEQNFNNNITINLKQNLKAYNEYTSLNFTNFKNTNQIAEPFCLVISVLKFLGNSPISCEKIPTGDKNQDPIPNLFPSYKIAYEIKFFSIQTILAAIIAFHTIAIWILFFINIGLGIQFVVHGIVTHTDIDLLIKEESSSDNQLGGMVQNTYCVTSTIIIIELISRWVHAGKFVEFLNKWEDFEKKMDQIFPHYDYNYDFSSLTNFRDNLLLFYVVYPSMILLPAFLSVYCSTLNFMVKILGFLICFQFIAVSLLEDVKVIMSYKALQLAFNQVRCSITYYEENQNNMGFLTTEKAQGWRYLILSIREQCDRASVYQKFEELTRMAGYIAIVTMFVYIILNGWEHAKQRGDMLFILSFAGYGGMLIGRMYFKAVMAESITTEELLLAKAILRINSTKFDAMTHLELKALVDVAILRPAQICFGNYVVLNKRLLLGISSQVVAYLIVLMQFSQPSVIRK